MALSKQQERFYRRWEKRRKSKLRYVLFNGVILIGLLIAFLLAFISASYSFQYFELSSFLLYYIPGSIIGAIYSHFQFKRIDKDYKLLKKGKVI